MRHILASAFVALAGLSGPAGAHPHIFIDATAGLRFDAGGRLAALRITWTYDPFSTLLMYDMLGLQGQDPDRLSDADRDAIVEGETTWTDDYNGDVYLDIGGAPVAMGRPLNGDAWIDGDRISVAFDLPLAQPLAAPDGARLRLYDPYYYYAYTVVGVDMGAGAPCAATITPFELDDASRFVQVSLLELGREETPQQEDVGALFADEVTLSCD